MLIPGSHENHKPQKETTKVICQKELAKYEMEGMGKENSLLKKWQKVTLRSSIKLSRKALETTEVKDITFIFPPFPDLCNNV